MDRYRELFITGNGIFVHLYQQYVLPHLEFAIAAWSPWTVADKETLERVQQRAVKMVAGLTATEYEDRLAELDMVTLEERKHQQEMALVYRIVHGHDRVDPGQWFTHVSSERVTRPLTRLTWSPTAHGWA